MSAAEGCARPARDGDVAELAQIHKACFAEAWDEGALRDLVASGAHALVAQRAGCAAAGFVLVRAAADEAEILTLAVAPGLRRRGLGRMLVTEAARWAAQAGAARLFLEVGAGNAAARALYCALGFAEAGRRKAYYRGGGKPPEDALILAAPLPLSGLGNGRAAG
jgi:ribosomal-protein-alanine N-acetyltransferase